MARAIASDGRASTSTWRPLASTPEPAVAPTAAAMPSEPSVGLVVVGWLGVGWLGVGVGGPWIAARVSLSGSSRLARVSLSGASIVARVWLTSLWIVRLN